MVRCDFKKCNNVATVIVRELQDTSTITSGNEFEVISTMRCCNDHEEKMRALYAGKANLKWDDF
jgi:hypothetical protein